MMIDRSLIDEMFARARSYTWDVHALCRWSYFFVSRDRTAFDAIAQKLETTGYEIVGTLAPTPSDENSRTFLRVDRIERHTPASLEARNAELSMIAATSAGVTYDGMDVGPIDSP